MNPCIKCMECSVTQFGVSEFCETLTGGFTRKTPRRSNSQKSENLEEWNTQSGGIARGVELPVELPPALHKEPEPEGSHWFRLLMKELPGGGAGSSQSGVELPEGRGVELPGGGTRKSGTPRGQGGGTPRGWNPQE